MIEKSKDVPAFVRCCSILVPSVFDDSMSYYEVLCALTKYLKDEVVGVINNNAEVTKQYAKAVEELEKYVRDYFKNLDVQEEINNKLDEMVEDGTLQEIISDYLSAYVYIENVKYSEHTYAPTNTKYFVTHIPAQDEHGNAVRVKLGLANDKAVATGELETARSFAKRHKATLVINGGVADNASSEMTGKKFGMVMKDGVLISNNRSSWWQAHWALGIKEDGGFVTFGPEQTEEKARELGCVDVVSGFTPVMINSQSQKFMIETTANWFTSAVTSDVTPVQGKVYYTHNNTAPYYTPHYDLTEFESGVVYYEITDDVNNKQIIGQNTATKDVYIITSNGRGQGFDIGITTDECVNVLRNLGCDFAYQLDAGGSTSAVYHDTLLNNPLESNGNTTERPCATFLYVGYDSTSPYGEEMNNINSRISDMVRENQLSRPYDLTKGTILPSGANLNNYTHTGVYYSENSSKSETIINTPNISNYVEYTDIKLYGFKLVCEHLTVAVRQQTMMCESNVKSHPWIFTRVYSHNGTEYVWSNWVLVTPDTYSVPVTMESDYTINNKQAYCKNNRVAFSFEFGKTSGTFSSTLTKIATINARVKPKSYIQFSAVTNNSELAVIQITNGGELKVSTKDTNATKIRGFVTYDI